MNDASPRPPRPDPMAIARRITEGFGAQVKRLRQARAMTQTDLGNAAYLTVDHIGKIERGTRPKLLTIAQIAAGLRVPVGHLFPQAQAPMAPIDEPVVKLLGYLRQRKPEDAVLALSILRLVFER